MSAPKLSPDARRKRLRRLAARIAGDLFTNGAGHHATRLVLELNDGGNGGGWSEKAAADRIYWLLRLVKP